MFNKVVVPLSFTLLVLSSLTASQTLTNGQIDVVSARLSESALLSWELGVRMQTILELNATAYSVLSTAVSTLPPPSSIPTNVTSSGGLLPVFAIAKDVVSNRTIANNHTIGPQPLLQADGSAGDPASVGIGVLLANWTGQDGGQVDYSGAAADQINFLLEKVPRTSDGAISHRVAVVQLWSDFVYMVPPFLAYYGVMTQNRTVLAEAYNQIKLYRSYLRDSQTGLWNHVLLGNSTDTPTDPRFWSTGNGWAAAGILRVLMTIRGSQYANTFTNEQSDLAGWVSEIHAAVYPHLDATNVFANYADQPISPPDNFYDAASTALLASTVYRASVLLDQHTYIPYAERSRMTLFSTTASAPTTNDTTLLSDYSHLTSDGWLTPVVNPHDYVLPGVQSPEAQAFVVQLHAAHRDWVLAGSLFTDSKRNDAISLNQMRNGLLWAAGSAFCVSQFM